MNPCFERAPRGSRSKQNGTCPQRLLKKSAISITQQSQSRWILKVVPHPQKKNNTLFRYSQSPRQFKEWFTSSKGSHAHQGRSETLSGIDTVQNTLLASIVPFRTSPTCIAPSTAWRTSKNQVTNHNADFHVMQLGLRNAQMPPKKEQQRLFIYLKLQAMSDHESKYK